MSVINNAFVNVCREMGTAMMRTSYSPIFNEGLDFSCMLFNLRGDLIGQAEFCPTMLGSCQYAMKWMLDEVGLDAFGPGDVFIHNDPYRGQCHMPEHLVVKAVFHEGKPWGFVGNIAHVGEIGGMAPGSFAADATEVYQEGLRLPPLKIMDGGEYVKDIWRIVLANHRTPEDHLGRLPRHDRLAPRRRGSGCWSCWRSTARETLADASDQLLDYSERFMRAEIAEMPDGVYYAQDCMEDDGVTNAPLLDAAATDDPGRRGHLRLDRLRRSGARVRSTRPSSSPRPPATAASCTSSPNDIPINSGCYRPIRLVTRPGSLVNVKHPGPSVGGNTETHPHIQNVVMRALAGAVPERVAAAEGASSCNFLFGGFHPEYGDYYTNYHIEGSGWGGTDRPRRQQRPLPEQRQLPQHPGRDPGDEVPLHRRASTGCAPTRPVPAAGEAAWPARASSASRRRRSPSTPSSTARGRRPGHLRRRSREPAAASSSSGRDDRVPPLLGDLRHRLRFQVHPRGRDRRRPHPAQLGRRRRLRRSARAAARTASRRTCGRGSSRRRRARPTATRAEEEANGEWRENDAQWYEERMLHCGAAAA